MSGDDMPDLREEIAGPVAAFIKDSDAPPTVIIDTDPGIDDSMALLLAFAAHKRGEIKIIGITIVHGNNNDIDMLARNACFLLQVAGLSSEIPVYKGREAPIDVDYHGHSGILVHGPNGLGGVELPFEPDVSPIRSDMTAAEYLVSTVASAPGTITVVTLGPLSNIGAAIRLSSAFAPAVKRLVMMGGDTLGTGNKAPGAEANVHNDPDAAKLMFNAVADVVMAGLNVTRFIELSEPFRLRIRDSCGEVGTFIYAITQHYVDLLSKWKVGRIAVHDSTAIMALIRPEIFLGAKCRVDVETSGDITRGVTIADWANHWKKTPQTLVLKKVNSAAFKDLYIDYVSMFAGVSLSKA